MEIFVNQNLICMVLCPVNSHNCKIGLGILLTPQILDPVPNGQGPIYL